MAPQLTAELGEPILRCIALNAASMHDRMDAEELSPWWRPRLIVDGQPGTRLPRTMFLILTPTRILITDTKRGTTGYRPVLGSPILTLRRGDAETTAVRDHDGLWLYHLESRAESTAVELELASSDIAAELAGQLQEFSVAKPSAGPTSGPVPPPPPVASQMLDTRRRWRAWQDRLGSLAGVALSLVFFGLVAHQVYGYHLGTATTATIISCGGANPLRPCDGEWALDGTTHSGGIWGDVDDRTSGSSVDVHVRDGSAYAPGIPKWPLIFGALCALIAAWPFASNRWRRRGSAQGGPAADAPQAHQREQGHQ